MADNFGLKIGVEGEKEFKKALSDINNSMKVLGSEMKLVDSTFDKQDKSVQALTARNEVLNKNIEAQKQKIDTLRSALENASSSFGENDRRTQAWQIQLNNAEAALNGMERELKQNNDALDKTADEFDDAEKEADQFGKEIKKTGDETTTAGDKFKKVGEVLKGVGKAMAAAVAAIGTAAVATGKKLFDMATETANIGDEIDKTSQKLGMSAEAYQEWDYVLGQSGVEITSMTTGLKTLTNQIDDAKNGSDKAAERFAKLGISMEDLSTMSREDIFAKVVEGMQGMADSTDRAALANDLFGKSGQNLTPLFNSSAEATEELKNKAHELGFVMSDEAVSASAAFNDSLDTLQRTFTGVKNNIMGDLLPSFTEIMTGLSELLVGGEDAKNKIQHGAQEMVNSLAGIIPQIVDILITLITAIAEIAPGIIEALVQGVVNNLPQIIEAASNIIVTFLESLIAALPQIAQGALDLVMTLVNAILENLPLILETAIQVIVTIATGIADALPTLIPTIVSVIMQICTTLIDNLPAILDAALQIIIGLAQGILDAIPVLIEALPTVIESIINFIINAIPMIIDAGIQLLTSLVTALPTIIEAIVNALPQIIDAIITGILGAIPQLIEAGIKLLTSLIQNLPLIITTIVNALPQIITSIINAILSNIPLIIQAGIQLLISLIKNLPTIIVEIVKAVPQILSGLVSAFGKGVSQLADVGKNLVRGLWDGITSLASWIWDKVSGWAKSIWDGICGFFGIHSPSKKFAELGKYMSQGLGIGFVDEMKEVDKDIIRAIPSDFDINTRTHLNNVVDDITPAGRAYAATGTYGMSGQVLVQVPLYLDGNEITESTGIIQSGRNMTYKRALGVT